MGGDFSGIRFPRFSEILLNPKYSDAV